LAQAFGSSSSLASQTNCWFKKLPDTATTGDYIGGLGMLILAIVGITIGGALMNGLMFYLMNWAGQHVLRTLRIKVFEHIHRLSVGYYAEHEAGAVMSRIVNDMDTLQMAVNFVLVNLVSGVVSIIWIGAKMICFSLPYALVSLAITPLMVIATVILSNQARKAFRVTRVQIGKVNANLEESIAGVREVQAFGREDVNIEAFRSSNAANRDANVKAVSYTAALQPTLEGMGYIAIAIVVITGGFILLGGGSLMGAEISLGLIITFIGYVQRFNQPISQISQLWTNVQSAVAGAERIFELLDTKADVQDIPNAQPLPQIQGAVAFENVSAAYVPGELVLKGVSFEVKPGQTVAIVGQTGAGKTTIMNLLPRFYDVVGGRITVDGYNVVLGEHDAGLSQGQRQLLAIARAALADPRILILDEATSSVDTRTERQIQSALEKLLKGRTSFVIAHRLSTIRNADQVLVVENGEIVERGTHASLLAQKGVYFNMYMRQFRRQETETVGGDGHAPAMAAAS
jgi:ATP-binding cassette, subfamily B, multidrug efflux pump